MRLLKTNYLFFGVILLWWGLWPGGLRAQESYRSVTPLGSIEIVPLHVSVGNDSVTLHWKIRVDGLCVPTNYSHVLVPILSSGQHSLSLPRVVISGRKRASYAARERELNPFQRQPYSVTVYRRRRPIPPIFYSVTFPYATWMKHCSLKLHQVSESALRSVLLFSENLCANFLNSPVEMQQPDAPVQVAAQQSVPPAPADTLRSTRLALFLAYPVGFSGINALFSDNAAELAKIDRLLLPLLNNPRLRIRRVLVTGYTSPDGGYLDNEQLAKKRAQEFVRYLRTAYSLPASATVRTAWVAEDWEGLRHYLERSDLPLRNRALTIIDHTGIFEGRERELMLLNGGSLYRNLKQTVFPQLRRIEVVVETEWI